MEAPEKLFSVSKSKIFGCDAFKDEDKLVAIKDALLQVHNATLMRDIMECLDTALDTIQYIRRR